MKIFGISEQEAIRHTSLSYDWNTIHEDGLKFRGKEHPSIHTFATGLP